MRALITGSNGLVGSQCVSFLCQRGWEVMGLDNDMRSYFFGKESSTLGIGEKLKKTFEKFTHFSFDVRDYEGIYSLLKDNPVDLIIHTAGQPSHDWASKEPLTDFSINALGTVNMLEAFRLCCPSATFIFTSTNKVYGDRPNDLDLQQRDYRYEYFKDGLLGAIDESMSIDACKHSVFGASKVAADIMVQEYGRYFNLKTGVFRCGCLTGPDHQGTELHGFLSYLVKCAVQDKPYKIYGDGKQVRDNLHAWDLVNMFWSFHQAPRPGAVYNAGGGRENSISMLEAINKINGLLKLNGQKEWTNYQTLPNEWRIGDHKWYISDLSKFKKDFPEWEIQHPLCDLLEEMVKKELHDKR